MANEKTVSKQNFLKKAISIALSATLLSSGFIGLLPQLTPSVSLEVNAASDYGLADNIQDGTILHCFDWTYNDIKAELPNIAAAGFTSVQTSPAQQACGTGQWYWAYQPLGFYIGNTFGTKEELKALCDEAHKYGIKVIVDAIGNHLAGGSGRYNDAIQSDLKDSQYWHNSGYTSNPNDGTGRQGIDWMNRWQVTHGDVGMPDLNTENSYVQQCAKNYLLELKSVGVDGIRWDTTKHIGLPSEGDNFWPTVTEAGLYQYGEILKGPDDRDSGNEALMKEYTQYMTVTDSDYGATLRNAFNSGTAPTAYGNWAARGISNDKLLYWGESHDTWSNNKDGGYSNEMSQNVIDRAYAVAASRNDITALYFSRPSSADKEQILIGQKGSTHFTSKEVAEVNKFHNAMVGKADYYTVSNNCSVITRKDGGAIVVAGSGGNFEVSVENAGGYCPAGTYTDQVSGNTWTVTSTTISGKIGDSGIAVIYNPSAQPVTGAKVSADPSTSTFTDSVSVKLSVSGATSGSYTTSEGASGTFTNGQTITLGSSTAVGGSVTLTLKATGDDGKQVTQTYTYTKKDPSAVTTVYFDNSSYNWSSVYAYIYKGEGATATKVAEWPGTAMTKDSATGYYKITIPEGFENGSIMFTESKDATTNRYPADQQPGLSIGGSSKIFSAGNSWKDYQGTTPPIPSTPTVTSSVASGSSFTTETTSITLTLANATSGTYTVDDGPVKTFTSSATVKIGEGKIGDSTVTVKATATGSDGTTKTYTFTYEKKYVKVTSTARAATNAIASAVALTASSSSLSSKYSTNGTGTGVFKTISVDGDISDWDSSMLIAQGAANDDPRVYRPNSMYEVGLDMYALYAAYDNDNVYLMWEMTNVQDVVAPNDNFPLTQGTIYTNQEFPFFMVFDTGKSDAVGNKGMTADGGYLWGINTSFANSFNKIVTMNCKGGNGPYVYGGDSSGINPVELLDAKTSGVTMKFGQGILSKEVIGINGAYGEYNGRVLGDMCSESADWVDFNTKGHNSATMDYFYEVAIPYEDIGITVDDIKNNGIGVMVMITSGASGMDCLPYDLSMNDNADQSDPTSNPENSLEKSDEDYITASFARIGKSGGVTPSPSPDPELPLQVNFGADRSAPQEAGTSLTLKGIGYGGSGSGYKYEFSIDGEVVQASSATATYTWVATGGTHTIACKITDSTGATATSSKTYTVEGDAPVNPLVNSSTISATSVTKGNSVTLTGKATGGTTPYQYEMLAKLSTASSYTTLKSYNTTATKTWTPANVGTYNVRINVKDASGTVKSKDFTLTVKAATTALTNNSTISATSITKGQSVTMTGKASGGTSPYQYAMVVKHSTDSSWTTLKAYNTTATKTWTPAKTGTYTVQIKVKDANGTALVKTFTLTVKAATAALVNNSEFSTVALTYGESLTMTGKASGGTAPYQYAMVAKHSTDSTWTTLKAYSTTATKTWKPAKTGTYTVQIKVKDANGTVVVKSATITVKAATAALANNSTISATSITKGQSVTMTGKATGGTAPYQYAMVVRHSTDSAWTTLKAYNTTATKTWTPAKTGTYTVQIKVKDAKGTAVVKTFTLTVKDATAALANNSTISATSITKGQSVTMTGKATGGTSPYQYAMVVRHSTDSTWTTLKAYNTTATKTWTPAKTGTYTVQIKVKDAKGTAVVKTFTLTVKDATAALANSSTISATSITKGQSVTMTGKATGGTAPYQYAMVVRHSTDSAWTTLKAYNTTATKTWTPAKTGTYTVQIKVKDAKGTAVVKTFTLTVKAASTALANNSTISATSITKGNSVTMTGKATGGTAPYQYAMVVKHSTDSSWTTLKAYNTTATKTWTPAKTGTYTVQIKVKDANGTAIVKTFTLTVKA